MKKKILLIALTLIVVISLGACSNKKDEKTDKSDLDSIFSQRSKSSNKETENTTENTENTSENSNSTSGFTAKAQKEFYALAITGPIDRAHPELYLSPRWNAIIGYERPAGVVPVSELDDVKNSDLDRITFNSLRTLSISLSEAALTGKNSHLFPSYFTGSVAPDTCSNYRVQNAGVTKLPIASDGTWVIAVVMAQAKCLNSEEVHTTQVHQYDQTFFFNLRNGSWVAVNESQLPRS